MRRSTLELLRCPSCLAGSLVPEEEIAERVMIFGPVRCLGCQARYPVSEGLIDLVGDSARPGSFLHESLVGPRGARTFERYLRPALDTLLTTSLLDRPQELASIHDFIGPNPGPVVDIGCGPGVFLQRYARSAPGELVVGVDVSRPMLEEAIAHVRENGLNADFVCACVPPLSFIDHSLGTAVASGLLQFIEDGQAFVSEVARALRPAGRLVATTYDAWKLAKGIQQRAGLYPRSVDELEALTTAAGLVRFEVTQAGPMLVVKAEAP